ncbi:MAG: pyrimidine 5'-nucleotidase [Proteobacteria bacterium]|nr:pyrimidine 5'-nucleotidase [Pseudomonadota bacterium]
MDRFRHINTWVFDLDNTLYDAETGVFARVGDRMTNFIVEILKISPEEANALRKEYWKKYGTSMRGLMVEHKIDPYHFLDRVHDVDITDVPQCPITKEYLDRLPGKKIIFTNAPRPFATRMTKHLGIDHHFDHVFTIEDADFLPKPNVDTYHTVIKKFNFEPKHACMFEDTAVNLKPASDLGMTTVWFHGKNQSSEEHHHPHIHHKAGKLADWLQHTVGPRRK